MKPAIDLPSILLLSSPSSSKILPLPKTILLRNDFSTPALNSKNELDKCSRGRFPPVELVPGE